MFSFMHGSGFGAGIFMILSLLFYGALFVGILVFILWAVRQMRTGRTTQNDPRTHSAPEEFLKARYAKGEITRDEYLATLADLKK
jgi:uncharacterized membrane protein